MYFKIRNGKSSEVRGLVQHRVKLMWVFGLNPKFSVYLLSPPNLLIWL